MRKLSSDQFIEQSRLIHGDKYDYSQITYVNNSTKLKIICPVHGDFWQTPNHHLSGQGCRKCAGTEPMDTLSFLKRANEIHGDRFDYSKVNYVNARTKICIVCLTHGDFLQSPHRHLRGDGCAKCAGLHKKSTEQFIMDANAVHGAKYDYSKVHYTNSSTPVRIVCPTHGEFRQTPNRHLSGSGCPLCAGTKKKSLEEFILRANEIHGGKYDYSKAQYANNRTPILITCKEHGDFWQTPDSHLLGHGCHLCANTDISKAKLKDLMTFISDARTVHGGKYDYSKVEYTGNNKKVCIRCPEHGEFWQTPHGHISGRGCPVCNNSELEKEVREALINNDIIFVEEKKFPWLKNKKNLRLDFFLPDYDIAIECQGIQHFESVEAFGGEDALRDSQLRDKLKREKCQTHGMKILYYSNLGIGYPYPVYEDLEELIQFITMQQLLE